MAPPKPQPKATKKPAPKTPQKVKQQSKASTEPITSTIPLELQQLLLNIFKNAFSQCFESDIKPLLQEVKGHLYNRDFLAAFGKDEYLEAYAARWSPSRALGYLQVLDELGADWDAYERGAGEDNEDKRWKTVCLGGGAGAEIVALAGPMSMRGSSAGDEEAGKGTMEVVAIDIANWSPVVEKLHQHITTAPPLSKYASAAAQSANAPLVHPTAFTVSFHQHDILTTPFATLSSLLQNAHLVTLMFTLNELYSASLALTQTFLLNLTTCLTPGALLLVVDSPGSYSTVSLNGAEKKYPMQWLLDHTLLKKGARDEGGDVAWEKVREDGSRWFRLGDGLRYPIELENMRFQMHLYRRLG
ncbi:hypothetical protein BU26DRAFT_516722 [Trematosphaeria pertusa]|uniref:25S rRNA (Uridine(2843)-N(3))-methyltransferase n=1 Tax=Trematosphaeria pertusa TaxID=390896 RepID=A0A6A6IN64_9PLEO|nr:uncharacterized protein BU26DRAFT_516722 [Trematosphaeria pertusa]KAF2252005.1 hypothetical protein BU26DRAFT_516722 [Trematosphaeria pertusa]